MGEKFRNSKELIAEKMLEIYGISDDAKGLFYLQVDCLLENAVYPTESNYAENISDLWNIYMPAYRFDQIILEYLKKCHPVLCYIHDGEIQKFNSIKNMQDTAIKNFIKYQITQGKTNRLLLVKECFDTFKDISDKAKLYDLINNAIELYFVNGEIGQQAISFLKRFQDSDVQPYMEIMERLSDICDQKQKALLARKTLYEELHFSKLNEEEFYTLLNVFLCKLAVTDGEERFSEVLENTWNNTFEEIRYSEKVYTFIEKYERAYMNAACFSIKNIKNEKVVRQLYKDAIILITAVENLEKGNFRFGLREINDVWKREGMRFSSGYFFNDEYERMKSGLYSADLLKHKNVIKKFHELLLDKINMADFSVKTFASRKKDSLNMGQVVLNEKERKIVDQQEKITELEEKIEMSEKEVLSQFISLLDSKKYDHVLGKLYRIAYSADEIKLDSIKLILKNLFEIMNISGIDVYGEVDTKIKDAELKKGKYRLDAKVSENALIKYPGYKIGNYVILRPLVEEV